MINRLKQRVQTSIVEGTLRDEIIFLAVDFILAAVSFIMTVVNIFTGEYIVMYATMTVFIICMLNLLFMRLNVPKKLVHAILYVSIVIILFFFVISGHPDGFSALWLSLIPVLSMMLMGMKLGTVYSLFSFAGLIFLFWTDFGNSLLQYEYGSTFLLRYPFFYMAVFMLALSTEYIRAQTHEKLLEANEKFSHLYKHDALTGLYNRYGINEKMKQDLAENQSYSIIIMDIDDFKKVNDTYGHDAGDAVLKEVAARIRSAVQSVGCKRCSYARWGGEEFLVYVPGQKDAVLMAEKIRSGIEEALVLFEGQKIHVTMSLGVCRMEVADAEKDSVLLDSAGHCKEEDSSISDTPEHLLEKVIQQADQCLYKSKTTGKNKVTVETFSK